VSSLVIKDGSLVIRDGSLLTDAGGAPCCCGGGGGGDCCVCGLCKPTGGPPLDTAATMLLSGGGEDSGCCVAQTPTSDGCAISTVSVVNPSVTFSPFQIGSAGGNACWLSGGDSDTGQFEQEECFGSPGEWDYSEGLGVFATFAESDLCPQFIVPGTGAIVGVRSLQGGGIEPAVTVWGGSRCSGPLVMATMIRTIRVEPSELLASIYIFAVVGAGGGAAYIARVGPWCPGWPVIDGCVWIGSACGVKPGPLKVGGGGSASGVFDCDSGEVSLSGSINASYTSACSYEEDQDGGCSSIDPPCQGIRPTATGPFSVSFDYDVSFNLNGLLEPCDGNRPDKGRDSNSDIGESDALPLQLVVPGSFLDSSPILRDSYDDIRRWLRPSTTQTPPPGGFAQDPRIAATLDQQARGGGCRGCGDGFTG